MRQWLGNSALALSDWVMLQVGPQCGPIGEVRGSADRRFRRRHRRPLHRDAARVTLRRWWKPSGGPEEVERYSKPWITDTATCCNAPALRPSAARTEPPFVRPLAPSRRRCRSNLRKSEGSQPA